MHSEIVLFPCTLVQGSVVSVRSRFSALLDGCKAMLMQEASQPTAKACLDALDLQAVFDRSIMCMLRSKVPLLKLT